MRNALRLTLTGICRQTAEVFSFSSCFDFLEIAVILLAVVKLFGEGE